MTSLPSTLPAWLHYIQQQHPVAIDLGLERIRSVAKAMHLAGPARRTITVAGTNGKGSTVSFLDAIARSAGLTVGTFTSPHLLRYNECIQFQGQPVSDEALMGAFEVVELARGATTLTEFEYTTLAALWLFAQVDLDLVVLEVGLGGSLDAVNIVDADLALITTVDIDHTQQLGTTREQIGAQKAGIIRPARPVVVGEIDPPATVLRQIQRLHAPCFALGRDYFYQLVDDQQWRWRNAQLELRLPLPSLAGPIQLANAAAAIAALRALALPIPTSAWSAGIAAAHLPARLQAFDRDGVQIRVDVGHNPQAATQLARALKADPPSGRTFALYAALRDKNVVAVVRALQGCVTHWTLAGLSGPRGQSADLLRERLQETVAADAELDADVGLALSRLVSERARRGDRILVFGSFQAAAAALSWLHLHDSHGAPG